jgi:hypothetical protein
MSSIVSLAYLGLGRSSFSRPQVQTAAILSYCTSHQSKVLGKVLKLNREIASPRVYCMCGLWEHLSVGVIIKIPLYMVMYPPATCTCLEYI